MAAVWYHMGLAPPGPSPRLPHILRGRVVLNPACAQRCISPEQWMPGSYEVILEGSTFHHFFRLKGRPFLIDPPRGDAFLRSLYYALGAAVPPGTASETLGTS